MRLEDLQKTWASLDKKIERNWKLNLEIIRRSNLDKVKNKMNNLIWVKAATLAFYFLFSILFLMFSVNNWEVIHMAATGIVFAIWTISICVATIHELQLITNLDYSTPIPEMQKRLSAIRLMIIRYLRLGVWIAPLYFGFIILLFKLVWNIDIVAVGNQTWIASNFILSIGVFVPFAIWAHFKLSPKNAEKRWMNALLRGNGSQIVSALALTEEIERFEKEQ